MERKEHFTTRRSFIAAGGFGGLSLYGLWAAYGAAPSPWALLGLKQPPADASQADAAHAGHGAATPTEVPSAGGSTHGGHGGAAAGPSPETFSRQTAEFAERYRMPDGSVYPRRLWDLPQATAPHAGHALPSAPDPHAGHGSAPHDPNPTDPHAGHFSAAPPADQNEPIDVLMTAGKWYYLPNLLRLDAGQAYRFRMMSVDIAHGASIQLGNGGRMMRLQPGRVTEAALTFRKPGRYLMVCTVYCGEAHQLMQATIEVV